MGDFESMIFLDTHTAFFLFASMKKVPRQTLAFLYEEDLVLSPMARFELDILHEIQKIKVEPRVLAEQLYKELGVTVETEGWVRAAEIAQVLNWTRDPFDRLITAHAMVWSAPLLTRDAHILNHYPLAFWEELPAA